MSEYLRDVYDQPATLRQVLSFYEEEGQPLLRSAGDLFRGRLSFPNIRIAAPIFHAATRS